MFGKLIGLMIFMTISTVFGADSKCEEAQIISISDRKVRICFVENEKVWLDETCIRNPSCGARQFLRPMAVEKVSPGPADKNPCSDKCHSRGGEIQFGVNERGSSTSFCIAKDKSMVDCSRL
jgi:putative hemolysin